MVCLSYQSDFEAGRNSCTTQGQHPGESLQRVKIPSVRWMVTCL